MKLPVLAACIAHSTAHRGIANMQRWFGQKRRVEGFETTASFHVDIPRRLSLRCALLRDFLTLLARFREAYGDGLLTALHGAAFSALTAFESAFLAPFHGALDGLRCTC